jgi:hypothetical protein
MADQGGGGSSNNKPSSTSFGDVIKANFGGYLIAAVAVIVTYSVVDAIYPQYSTPLALVTLLGIAIFYMNRSKTS